jgi:type IV pilus assembly protein PilW
VSARSCKLQRGLSMVELMVAIVLGLLVTDALVAMFVGVRSAGRLTSGVSALSDSGRFALDTIEQTVRGAGNIACNSSSPVAIAGNSITRVMQLLAPGGSPLIADYGDPVAGYEAVSAGAVTGPGAAVNIANAPVPGDNNAGDWVTTPGLGGNLDAILSNPPPPQGDPAGVGAPVQGSDILVVHETLPGQPPSYTIAPATGSTGFTINSASTFAAGSQQVGAITNCMTTEVFQLGGFNPGGGNGTVLLSGPLNNPGQLPNNIEFDIGAQVVPEDTTVFYIGVGEDGDGALFRWETNGGVLGDANYGVNAELVPDVENMQILYGVEDPNSAVTETVAQYVTADQVHNAGVGAPCQITVPEGAVANQLEDFNCVISVKLALLVASPPGAVQQGVGLAASPPTLLGTNWALAAPDGRMRQVYEQTMFLRNMSP